MKRIHELKTWPHAFNEIKLGNKTCEIRKNTDRDFAEGDVLLLRKYDPSASYTGYTRGSYVDSSDHPVLHAKEADTVRVRVSHIIQGGQRGLPSDLCVMSIRISSGEENE